MADSTQTVKHTDSDIPKAYDPRLAESKHYQRWEAQGCFAPERNRDPKAPVFSIVIPPPNVTGSLHMGHALQHTLMDVLTRYHRMCGYRTLWLPGTDHAGISTQIVVERELKKEGLTRHDLGRERFVERVWQWKEQYGSRITEQLRREGASVDWSRERFTMDERLSRAVREAFVRLYEEGLIYRGDRIINWCPTDQTALSDLEVEKEPHQGKLYYLQYPIKGSERRITVATTRPETMLGDTAVAVNPRDARYRDLIGQTVILPLVGREIPIIADEAVDPEFGTGAVKVTPAHDPNDYEMGRRHHLPPVVIMDQHARMTEAAGPEFVGLDRYEARERVVQRFSELGLLERVEDYEFAISRCDRCRTVIEPLISTQWFCRMKEMAQAALDALARGRGPRFVPEVPWTKVYGDWLENIHDWCISRQLWWGHRIPAWYTEDGRTIVARSEEEARSLAGTDQLEQDPDVLDTWFSSALWPFSTLGWPDDTDDLKTFYPTSVLVTARDIIFLWVSRMVMTGLKFVGEVPFRDVVITALILDKHGQKMSKMKGNTVDPLDLFDKYGVDATRITLAAASTGTDVRWRDEQVESFRNFANKIWNAARFCLLNAEGATVGGGFSEDRQQWALHDRWIVSRLDRATERVNAAIKSYEFHDAVQALYHFFWDDFCDWYIELTKVEITASEASPAVVDARSRLLTILEQALRLLHPFMPYITEEIWQRLPGVGAAQLHPAYADAEPTIMLASFPQNSPMQRDEQAEREMQAVIDLIKRVRNIRSEMNIKPAEQVRALVGAPDARLREVFAAYVPHIARLTRASEVVIGERLEAPRASARAAVSGGAEVAIPLEGLIDFDVERERLQRERMKLQKELEKINAQLMNTSFIERAPAERVAEVRARLADITQRMKSLEQALEALG
ncbi:MAG: valine--tRNA ligase [Pyrinomonas sp.]|uniref:valine--tRNA ligase n=1 Tax=Pyrinomonas sp. TaxID=2080306 RepID=UPI0033310428